MTVYDARPIGLEYNYNRVCDIMQLFGEAQNNTAVMVDHIHPATTVDLPYFTGYTQFAAWPTPQLVRNINLFNE